MKNTKFLFLENREINVAKLPSCFSIAILLGSWQVTTPEED